MTSKFPRSSYYLPRVFKDTYSHVKTHDKCQKVGNISKRNELPQHGILELVNFYFLGIDCMKSFPSSFRNQ